MKEFNTLDDFELEGKTVILRVDFNMPLDKETLEILDTTRIERVLPTIKEITENNGKTVILAHQGRKGSWDFINLEKHAKALEKLMNKEVKFVEDICGEKAINAIKNMKKGDILILDNVRKLDYETEKKTAEEHSKTDLIKNLSSVADIFVNDAFAAAHRAQCSLIGFTKTLPSAAGRLMEKEITTLKKILEKPEKPSIFMFGGAKFSDVIVTIERVLRNKTADKILLTGLPANAFLKSEDYKLGDKNEETLLKEGKEEQFSEIKKLDEEYNDEIYLPIDFAISENNKRKEISLDDLPTDKNMFDIGTNTINKFKEILKNAKTIFLSGPCGVFEEEIFIKGTKEIFTFVSELDAFSIVGGGHTVAAVKKLGLENKMSHISTGGGSLEKFMMGEKLPVIEALKEAKNKHLKEAV